MLAAQVPNFSEEEGDALILYEGAVLRVLRAEDHDRALRLLEKAQGLCLVARALSAKHIFLPSVEVALQKGKNKTLPGRNHEKTRERIENRKTVVRRQADE